MSRLFDTEAWGAITETAEQMTALIDDALHPGDDRADLDGLYSRLMAALEALGGRLPTKDRDQRVSYLAPLAMLFDERVLGRLSIMSMGRALDWPSLQTGVDSSRFGGDMFFRRIDVLLAEAPVDPLRAQIYLWCLEQGFFGRHADDPGALDDYQTRLWAALEQPELPTEAPIISEVTRFPGLPRTRTIVLLVLAMAVVWQLVLVLTMRSVSV